MDMFRVPSGGSVIVYEVGDFSAWHVEKTASDGKSFSMVHEEPFDSRDEALDFAYALVAEAWRVPLN